MPNLKIDIIYYKTASDFEMEFNLSGCCRMRIFKEKLETKKEFVTSLSRDVSRSKVIIIVTDLFGEDSIIPTLSRAIGLPLTTPDNSEFGIKTVEDIFMPSTAVPLVTKSGIYGGCIIESGPQSIIIVSNVRSLRHEIMKTYVHNYVFDVGQLYAYQQRMGQNAQIELPVHRTTVQEATPPTPSVKETVSSEISNSSEDVEATTVETTESELNAVIDEKIEAEPSETVPAEAPSEKEIDDTPPPVSEDTATIHITKSKKAPGISEDCDFDITSELPVSSENASNKKKSGGRRATSIILLIIVILLLIAFGILAYYFVYLPAMGIENDLFGGNYGFFEEINTLLNRR